MAWICVYVHVCRSEGNSEESVLSFLFYMDFKDRTQIATMM